MLGGRDWGLDKDGNYVPRGYVPPNRWLGSNACKTSECDYSTFFDEPIVSAMDEFFAAEARSNIVKCPQVQPTI